MNIFNKIEYPYTGTPFSTPAAMFHILDRYAGESDAFNKNDIIGELKERHESLGGQPTEDDLVRKKVGLALGKLPNATFIATVQKIAYWKIGTLEIGAGAKWVYCFYYAEDRNRALQTKSLRWRCNIGRTERDPIARIKQQIDESKGNFIVPLLVLTDGDLALESYVHGVLKKYQRQLTDENRNEDFETCPSEVADIVFKSPYFVGKKIGFWPPGLKR